MFLLTWLFYKECLCPSPEDLPGFPHWEYPQSLFRHLSIFNLYSNYLTHVLLDHRFIKFFKLFYCFVICCTFTYLNAFYHVSLQIHSLPFPVPLCWRLPITNGTSGFPCLLPPALVQPLGGTGRSGSRVRYLFPQLSTCATMSRGWVLPKSKVSIRQSSPIAVLVPLNCLPPHHFLGHTVVMAPCCCQWHPSLFMFFNPTHTSQSYFY